MIRAMRLYFFLSICLFATALFFQSCSNEVSQQDTYCMNVEKIEDSVSFHQLVDSYEYIQLEKNDKCLIGKVEQLVVKDNLIYVLSDGIYCFNMDGSHRFSINQKGHSAREYTHLKTISISDDLLCAYDDFQWKLMFFNKNDGKFVKSVKLPWSTCVEGIYVYGDYLIADRGFLPNDDAIYDERFLVYKIDDLSSVIARYSLENYKVVFLGDVSYSENGLLYSSVVHNELWRITPNGMSKYFFLECPESMSLTESEKELMSMDYYAIPEDEQANKLIILSNLHENKQFITGRCCYKKQFVNLVYDKKSGKHHIFTDVYDCDSWIYSPVDIISADNDYFYSVLLGETACFIKRYCDIGEAPKTGDVDKKSYEIYRSIKEDDNPIVVRYKFKNIE